MTLDDETLALLGYARAEGEYERKPRRAFDEQNVDTIAGLLDNRLAVKRDRDIGGTRDIDGRHRRNWRHRWMP